MFGEDEEAEDMLEDDEEEQAALDMELQARATAARQGLERGGAGKDREAAEVRWQRAQVQSGAERQQEDPSFVQRALSAASQKLREIGMNPKLWDDKKAAQAVELVDVALDACGETREGETKLWKEALALFRDARQAQLPVTSRTFGAAMRALKRLKEWQNMWLKALEMLLVTMPASRLRIDAVSLGGAIYALPAPDHLPFGSRPSPWQLWQPAIHMLEDMRGRCVEVEAASMDAVTFVMWNNAKSWRKSTQCLADARRHGFGATDSMFAFAMNACTIKNKDRCIWARSLSLIVDLLPGKLMRSRKLFNAALSAAKQFPNTPSARQWQFAASILAEMRAIKLTPSSSEYARAIYACRDPLLFGGWRCVLQHLADMQKLKVDKDVRVCAAAVYALALPASSKTTDQTLKRRRRKLWGIALDLFKQGQALEVDLHPALYRGVFEVCGSVKDWEMALEVFSKMRQKGADVTPDLCCELLYVSEACERWAWSRDLLDMITKIGGSRNSIVFTAALNACRRSGRWDIALQLYQESREDNVVLRSKGYMYLMEALESGGRFDIADHILDEATEIKKRLELGGRKYNELAKQQKQQRLQQLQLQQQQQQQQ